MENLICKNAGKSYKEKTVLKNVNLELEPGKIYGLAGADGDVGTMLVRLWAKRCGKDDTVIPDVRPESRIGCRQQVTQF